jgi:hypothetical protein
VGCQGQVEDEEVLRQIASQMYPSTDQIMRLGPNPQDHWDPGLLTKMKLITNSQKYDYTRLRTRIVTRLWNQQFKSFLHLRRLTEARSLEPPGVGKKK